MAREAELALEPMSGSPGAVGGPRPGAMGGWSAALGVFGVLVLAFLAGAALSRGLLGVILAGGIGAVATFYTVRRPAVMIAAFAIIEPFQVLLLQPLPAEARYADDLLMLAYSLTVIGTQFVKNPAAVVRDRFVQLIGGFVLLGLLSAVINGAELTPAFAGIFVTVDYALFFLALRCVPLGARDAKALIWAVLLPGACAVVLGVLQYFEPGRFMFEWQTLLVEGEISRPPSFFEHPNDFGFYLIHSLFIVAGAIFHIKAPKRLSLLLIFLLAGISVSVSRTSYAVVALGFVLLVLGRGRRMILKLLPVAIMVSLLTGNLILSAVTSRIEKVRNEGGDARLTYAERSIPLLVDHPFLGVGPGRFGGEVAHRYDSELYAAYNVTFNESWTTIDSFWVHLAVEAGLLGSLTFLGLLFALAARASRRAALPASPPAARALAEALPLLVAGYAVLACTSMAFEANSTAGLFWLIAGVALSASGDRIGGESVERAETSGGVPAPMVAETSVVAAGPVVVEA